MCVDSDGCIRVKYMLTEHENAKNEVENDIHDQIIRHLVSKKVNAHKTCSSICKLSGGGGIELGNEATVLLLGGNVDNEDEGTELSPIYTDEVRASSIAEIKHKQSQTDSDVELQLRANMRLSLARNLEVMLKQCYLGDL